MVWKIIDRQEQRHCCERVIATIEAVEHDNACADADQADRSDPATTIASEQIEGVSVVEAIAWADRARCPVTIYL